MFLGFKMNIDEYDDIEKIIKNLIDNTNDNSDDDNDNDNNSNTNNSSCLTIQKYEDKKRKEKQNYDNISGIKKKELKKIMLRMCDKINSLQDDNTFLKDEIDKQHCLNSYLFSELYLNKVIKTQEITEKHIKFYRNSIKLNPLKLCTKCTDGTCNYLNNTISYVPNLLLYHYNNYDFMKNEENKPIFETRNCKYCNASGIRTGTQWKCNKKNYSIEYVIYTDKYIQVNHLPYQYRNLPSMIDVHIHLYGPVDISTLKYN